MKRTYRQSGNMEANGRPKLSPYEPKLIQPASTADRMLVSPSLEKLRRTAMDKKMSAKPDAATDRAMERAARTNPIRKMSRNPFKAVK